MGTRINLMVGHDLNDFRNAEEVLFRLSATTGAAEAVRDYWLATHPEISHDLRSVWEAEPQFPREPGLRRFTGPGSLFLSITASAAHVRTGGRWRGFVANETLRRVHLQAFRAVARALGAEFMALFHDSDEVDDLFWSRRPPWECVERMERMWGPPASRDERADSSLDEAADWRPPSSLWFLEDIEGGA